MVVMQQGGANPKPPQRFGKHAFVQWAAELRSDGAEVYAVYEACGFGLDPHVIRAAHGRTKQQPSCDICCHVSTENETRPHHRRCK